METEAADMEADVNNNRQDAVSCRYFFDYLSPWISFSASSIAKSLLLM